MILQLFARLIGSGEYNVQLVMNVDGTTSDVLLVSNGLLQTKVYMDSERY